MSLISQRDREVAIRALEMYASEAETTEYYLGTPNHSSSDVSVHRHCFISSEYHKLIFIILFLVI